MILGCHGAVTPTIAGDRDGWDTRASLLPLPTPFVVPTNGRSTRSDKKACERPCDCPPLAQGAFVYVPESTLKPLNTIFGFCPRVSAWFSSVAIVRVSPGINVT